MTATLQQKLIQLLAEQNEFKPVGNYAKALGVSNRTTYSYLEDIQECIDKYHCQLLKVPGKGIYLEGDQTDMEALLESFDSERYEMDLSPIERREAIFYRLLQGETISYHQLADDYFVSRSSIVNDIKGIKEQYLSEGEEILQSGSNGTCLVVKESVLQHLLTNWVFRQFETQQRRTPLKVEEYAEFFKKMYPESTRVIQHVLEEVIRIQKRFDLPTYYIIPLFESLSILSMRVHDGYHLEEKEGYVFERVENLDTYYLAGEFAENLSQKFDSECTLEDILHINECFVANGLKNAQTLSMSSHYEQLVDRLIRKFSMVIDLDLVNDQKLRKGLLNHLIPMYFRILQGIQLPNPYIQEIKQQYSMMFHLTWFLLVDLEEGLNRRIPEDEIGFMMVHFQSALERNRDIKKILIVSQSGLLTSELLEMRVKKALPSIHVYEMISENELAHVDLSKVDLILSTVSLVEDGTPVIEMTTIPSEEELQSISQYITEHFFEKTGLQLGKKDTKEQLPLLSYLDPESIQLKQMYSSSEEVIQEVVGPLEDKGYVESEYLQSVLDRENMSSTAFETGVAIPHGNPEFVKKTTITIIVNEKKINWGEEKVDVIILFSVAKEDVPQLRTIIEPIYEVIHSREQVEKVFKQKQTAEEILSHFS